jgi:hypothetical protein
MRLISNYANLLSKPFVDERFTFNGNVLAGSVHLQDRLLKQVRASGTSKAILPAAVPTLTISRFRTPNISRCRPSVDGNRRPLEALQYLHWHSSNSIASLPSASFSPFRQFAYNQ